MALVRFIGGVFFRCGKHFCRSPISERDPAWLGRRGEQLAARHLKRHRYKVLYKNFRAQRGGEVDIVCRDRSCDTLVFVEVKTRRSLDYGAPSSAVNLAKQRLISRGALAWLKMLEYRDIRFRFDIVEVVMEGNAVSMNIIQDAFQLPEPYIY